MKSEQLEKRLEAYREMDTLRSGPRHKALNTIDNGQLLVSDPVDPVSQGPGCKNGSKDGLSGRA